MSNLLSVVIVLIAVITVIRKTKLSAQSNGDVKALFNMRPAKKKGTAAARYTNYRPHKDITSVSRDMGDRKGSALRDDKDNDWLARQLREEHRAFRATSEMFDLKIEHASHCDARLLEQFHKRKCDAAGVDLANGSTIHDPGSMINA